MRARAVSPRPVAPTPRWLLPHPARPLSPVAMFRCYVSCCSCSSFPPPDDLLSADSGKLLRGTRGINTKSVVPRHWRRLYDRFFSQLTVSIAIRRAQETVSIVSRARVVSPPRCAVRRRTPPLISTGSRLECEVLHAMPRSPAGEGANSGPLVTRLTDREICRVEDGAPRKRSASKTRTWQISC